MPSPGTLRAMAAEAEAARFVGRAAEAALIGDLLDDAAPTRLLYVHGPGGIGKSALLRAAARQAEQRGVPAVSVDARAPVVRVVRAGRVPG